MSSKPDTITIDASDQRSLTADAASVTIVLEGSTVFSGRAAFQKAKEVTELVDALSTDGIDPESVSIRDVRVESSSFAGVKSSSCRYTIHVREIPADLLPSALATIASRKQADLRSISWTFSTLEAEKRKLREHIIKESVSKADATASALGVRILGVYNFSESVDAPGEASERLGGDDRVFAARARKAKGPPPEIGFSLLHSGKLRISTKTDYRVSPIEKGEQGAVKRGQRRP